MTFAFWCVLLAALLPIIWVGIAKSGAEGYDNHKPRIYLSKLKDWPQRANWAQANAYEAFPPFAAAIIIAHIMGGNQLAIDTLAGVFIILRVLHGIFYIKDMALLRSSVWSLSLLCTIGLFLVASRAA